MNLTSCFTEFKNDFKQMPVSFNIYADFEWILKSVNSNKGFFTEKYQDHITCIFAYKLVCVDNKSMCW